MALKTEGMKERWVSPNVVAFSLVKEALHVFFCFFMEKRKTCLLTRRHSRECPSQILLLCVQYRGYNFAPKKPPTLSFKFGKCKPLFIVVYYEQDKHCAYLPNFLNHHCFLVPRAGLKSKKFPVWQGGGATWWRTNTPWLLRLSGAMDRYWKLWGFVQLPYCRNPWLVQPYCTYQDINPPSLILQLEPSLCLSGESANLPRQLLACATKWGRARCLFIP